MHILILFCFIFSKTLLVDPTDEEENLCSGIFYVITKDEQLCSVLNPGGSPLTDEIMLKCINSAKQRSIHVKALIDTSLRK